MARRGLSAFHLFGGVLAITLILSLLPARFGGWVNDVAAIAKLPAFPFTDLGMRVRRWFAGDPQDDQPLEGDAHFLAAELERYRSLAHQWRSRAEEFARINAQLQRATAYGLNVEFKPVNASIIARNAQSEGTVFELNVGSLRHGVQQGAVVVFNGSHLIGRISDVHRMSSIMVPITHPTFKLIRADVEARGGLADGATRQAPLVRVHLEKQKDGTFRAEAARDANIAVGDHVYLYDDAWPRTAQSMSIGLVDSINPISQNPVLVELIVRPRYDASQLGSLTVKVETTGADEGDASEPGGGS